MLSIIVPVFNVANYLDKCLESICAQTYTDFELILVDDGSKDKSPLICDAYAKRDHRIRVIHKENGGVSSARNAGLDAALGQYVMFVDSDDWIECGLCKSLMRWIDKVDFVVGGYTIVHRDRKEEIAFQNETLKFPEQIEGKFDVLYCNNFFNTPFSKIYKRSILDKQQFDINVALGEDFLFNLEYLSKIKRIEVVETTGYYYNCLNEGAATKKLRENDIEQIVSLYQKGVEFLHKYCPNVPESYALKKRFCLNGINLIQLICYSNKPQGEKTFLVRKLLENGDFIVACKENYDFPFKYDFPRKLCARRNWTGLRSYFGIKKSISYLRKMFNI